MKSEMAKLIEATKLLGFKPPIDGVISAVENRLVIDVFKLDEEFGKRDLDYNNAEATYKGKPISMQDYITIKYDETTANLIKQML